MEGEFDIPMEGFGTQQPFQERPPFIWVNPYSAHTPSGLPMLQGESSLQQLCDVNNSLSISLPGENVSDMDALQSVLSSGFSSYDQLGENMVSDDWIPQSYTNSSNPSNELSLRLSAYSSIQNQCSDKEKSQSQSQLSQITCQPRYLGVVQEILSQFASFSLENMDQQLNNSYLDHCEGSPVESLSQKRRGTEAERSQLLALLQKLDECYNQCLDETHTVISAFHAATELDPQKHACFALRTVSVLYKSLKERISNQILKMGGYDDGESGDDGGGGASGSCSRDQMERSFEKSFIQKQWALQQLKRKDQLLWRPQRGLPERSVSVLRAWMFQNFLHPYPKDAEKHLLAIKSGLTRSQVSNWFINARVRLWKPLIEEMYAELNRSRAANGDQGNEESNTYNCRSIRNSRYSMS